MANYAGLIKEELAQLVQAGVIAQKTAAMLGGLPEKKESDIPEQVDFVSPKKLREENAELRERVEYLERETLHRARQRDVTDWDVQNSSGTKFSPGPNFNGNSPSSIRFGSSTQASQSNSSSGLTPHQLNTAFTNLYKKDIEEFFTPKKKKRWLL